MARSHPFSGSISRTRVVRTWSAFHITHHVQVVVIDVNHLDRVLIFQQVRNRPPDKRPLGEVDRAFVVRVVLLRWSDQG